MYEVKVNGVTKEYTKEEFIKKYGQQATQELYKAPFNKHILKSNGKTITVTVKE